MDDYLPNLGRPDRMLPPVGVEHLYNDPNVPLTVQLIVIRGMTSGNQPTRATQGQHWMFSWPVSTSRDGYLVVRRVHLIQEIGYEHLTNWGARTGFVGLKTVQKGVPIDLKVMSLGQRRAFEAIANATQVRVPNGAWGCQDWCKSVLRQAVNQGLLTLEEMNRAIAAAERVHPYQ